MKVTTRDESKDSTSMDTATKDVDEFRLATIEAGKQFHRSWVDVAARLARVEREKLFEVWGFTTIYAYAARDLSLSRKKTDDLRASYAFLQKFEPEAARKPAELKVVPPQELVEVLAKAEQRGSLSDKDYKSLRETIWDEDTSPEDKAEAVRKQLPARTTPTKTEKDALKTSARAARKVSDDLAVNSLVPNKLKEEAFHLAEAIEKLSEKLQAA